MPILKLDVALPHLMAGGTSIPSGCAFRTTAARLLDSGFAVIASGQCVGLTCYSSPMQRHRAVDIAATVLQTPISRRRGEPLRQAPLIGTPWCWRPTAYNSA